MPLAYGLSGTVKVPAGAIRGFGPPPAGLKGELGQMFVDVKTNPSSPDVYVYNGVAWESGGNALATETEAGIVLINEDGTLSGADNSTVPTSLAVKTYADSLAIAGAPVATESTQGIGELASDAEAVAGTASTPLKALFVTPSNLAPVFASPSAIGGTAAAAGTFTALTANGSGAVSLTGNAASSLTCTAGDLTLDSAAGSVLLLGGEAAADAVRIQADNAAGGIDVDAGTGGIAVDSTGAISLDAAAASNFNVTGAGIDLTLGSAAGRVIIDAGEDAADAIYLHANAGTSETIRLHSDQGTDPASVHLESDVGGVTLTSGLASADAINLNATAGGVDIDGAGQINIASSQADPAALSLVVSNAAGGITHTGKCIYTPDAITADNAGTPASVSTVLTEITTDGDSNLDNVTLADGVDGQLKIFAVVAAGNAADSVKITPANMIGGTQITFAADPTGLGCMMIFDSGVGGWCVVANNGGTIA